jgi:hypothetical protein
MASRAKFQPPLKSMVRFILFLTPMIFALSTLSSTTSASSAAWLYNRCNSVLEAKIASCEGFIAGLAHAIYFAEYKRPNNERSWCLPEDREAPAMRREFIRFAKKHDGIMALPAGMAVALMYSKKYRCPAEEASTSPRTSLRPSGFVNVCVPLFVLRSGPGIKYATIAEIRLPKKTEVLVFDVDANWLKVRIFGEFGWTHRSAFGVPWTEMGDTHPSPELAVKPWPCSKK